MTGEIPDNSERHHHVSSKPVGAALSSLALLLGGISIAAFGSSAQAQIASAPATGTVVTVVSQRIADSRTGLSFVTFQAQQTQDLQIAGRGGVPLTGVAAAVVNVTAVNPPQDGYITVWPVGVARTGTSNVNFTWWMNSIANTVMVPLSSDGSVGLFNGSMGPARRSGGRSGLYPSVSRQLVFEDVTERPPRMVENDTRSGAAP